jgi:TPR repeat protein
MRTRRPLLPAALLLVLSGAGCGEEPTEAAEARPVEVAAEASPDWQEAGRLLGGVWGSAVDADSTAAHAAAARQLIEQAEREGGVEARHFAAVQRLTGRWVEAQAETARATLTALADSGHAPASLTLGMADAAGVGGPVDPVAANDHLFRAAEAGHPAAQHLLGIRLLDGVGADPEPKAAFAWIKRAADGGVVEAYSTLGRLYEEGIGTAASPFRAANAYRRAAEAGSPSAMHRLGTMQLNGRGVGRDAEAGYRSLRTAAELGYVPAALDLARFALRDYEFAAAFYYRTIARQLGPLEQRDEHTRALIDVLHRWHQFGDASTLTPGTPGHDVLGLSSKPQLMALADALIRSLPPSPEREQLARVQQRRLRQVRAEQWQEMDDFERFVTAYAGAAVVAYDIGEALNDALPEEVKASLRANANRSGAFTPGSSFGATNEVTYWDLRNCPLQQAAWVGLW